MVSKPLANRRQVLKSIGGSIGTIGVSGTVVGDTGDDWVEIVTARSGETPIRTKRVPKEWREHALHSRKVTKEVKKQFLDRSDIAGIGKIRSSDQYGGVHGFQVEVEVDPSTFRGGIPASVGGIEVATVPVRERGMSCRTTEYSTVPGGADARSSSGFGTAGCRVRQDSEWRMLTVAHLATTNECSDDPTGLGVQHFDNEFGTVQRYDENVDYMTVSEAYMQTDPDILDGYNYPVAGYVTKAGVEDAVANSTDVDQSGATTGHDTGPIEEMEFSDGWESCITYEGEGIRFDIQNAEGDSGAPVYYNDPINEEAIMYGLYSQWITDVGTWSCRGDDSLTEGAYGAGSSAYRLHNNHDITFDNY